MYVICYVIQLQLHRHPQLCYTYHSIVGNGDSLFSGLESCNGRHWTEDLVLEDAHLVVSLEDRGLHVVTAVHDLMHLTTTQHL